MSFDKTCPNRKDRRKPYYKRCEREDASCRPGGDCPVCKANREYANKKRAMR